MFYFFAVLEMELSAFPENYSPTFIIIITIVIVFIIFIFETGSH